MSHDEETKGLEREASTSQNPGSSIPSTTVSSDPTRHSLDPDDDEGYEDEIDLNEHVFDHPSTYMEQRWMWIPGDSLGLSKVPVEELREVGGVF